MARIQGKHVLAGFVVLLCMEIGIPSLLYLLWPYFTGSIVDGSSHIALQQQAWIHIFALLATALALLFYCMMQGKLVVLSVWGKRNEWSRLQPLFDFLYGAATWVIAYPIVAIIGHLIASAVAFFYDGPHADQVAIEYLKKITSMPLVLSITIFEIVTIVPMLEELLFRGFFQNWLRQYLDARQSIFLSSLIFSAFHFSFDQGVDNIELLGSLFVLSCFLGFLRERRQSLWASIGLHSMFNGMSIMLLLYSL